MNEISRHIEHISVSFRSIGFPAALVLVIAALAASLWYYRSSTPPFAGWMKRLLTVIRFAALFLIITGLSEPILHTVASVVRRQKTAVLVDTSASIDLPVDTARKQALLDALNEIRNRVGDAADIYTFDTTVRNAGVGEIAFTGQGTDIAGAVKTAAGYDGVSSIILLSDGRWNLGEDPAAASFPAGIPVHVVSAGSSAHTPELSMESVSAPPVAYEGKTLSIEATIASALPQEGTIPVSLVADGAVVASGTASFGGGTRAQVKFAVTAGHPGRAVYSAVIDPAEDSIESNNAQSASVQVLKSTFAMTIIAAHPSADLAFLRRALEAESSFTVTVLVDTGLPAREGALKEAEAPDAVIVLDGGGKVLTRARAESVVRAVNSGCGLWVIGSAFVGEGTEILLSALPVIMTPGAGALSGDISVKPGADGVSHFITSGVFVSGSRPVWDVLPPVTSVLPLGGIKPEGAVIAEGRGAAFGTTVFPAIVTGRHGQGKVVVMPLSGLWRWRLMTAGADRDDAFFVSFASGTVRWLMSDTDTSPLTITAGTGTFLSGQEIGFEGRLFDKIFMPVTGADISIVIDDDPGLKLFLTEKEPAVYRGSIRGIDPGEHRFAATAFVGDDMFAESAGAFTVERSSLETIDSAAAPDVLGAIAARTGGMSVTTAGVDSLFASLENGTVASRVESENQLAMNPFLPFAIILFLIVEWSFRRRKGML